MEVKLIEMWASPNVLHLRIGITSARGDWTTMRKLDLNVDYVLAELYDAGALELAEPLEADQPLPGMG
jgi:hypothetical protein